MKILIDEKKVVSELNCYKVELNNKPDLMNKTLNGEHSLILVVDMINGFCKSGALSSPRCGEIALAIGEFLDALPAAQKMFLRDVHDKGSMELKWFPEHCTTGKECAVVSELKGFARKSADLQKNSTNGFFSLIRAVPHIGDFSNIAVVGVCSDICVMQLSLTLRAYLDEINSAANVIVFTDLIETFDNKLHDADLMNIFALKTMEQSGVRIFKNIK